MDAEDRAEGRQGETPESIAGASERDCETGGQRKGTPTEAGFVYFISTRDGRFVKVGFSTSVERRLIDLTTGPDDHQLILLGSIPGTRRTEWWLHEKFATYRDRGEWFRYSGAVRRLIQAFGFRGLPAESDEEPDSECGDERRIRGIARAEARRCLEAMMVAAVPEFRKSLAGQHIKAGIAKARAKGRQIGRPAPPVAVQQRIWELSQSGKSTRAIAAEVALSRSAVHRVIQTIRKAADGSLVAAVGR